MILQRWCLCILAALTVLLLSAAPASAQLTVPEDVEIRKPGDDVPLRKEEQPEPGGTQTLPSGDTWTVDLSNGQRLEMVRVPAGEFLMGSPEGEPDRSGDERQHRVRISRPFWMGKCEVTQAQWQSVMGNNPSESRGDELPVEMVSWNDCRQFLGRLNAVTGQTFRLPTEEEWEFACRATAQAAWSCGESPSCLGAVAWFSENSGNQPNPVGRKQPNEFGLYDMHGNVYEWCMDQYVETYGATASETRDAVTYVRRGGSWAVPPKHCRSAFRGNASSEKRRNDVGLRVVMDVKPSGAAGL